jgi:hypothetical protein
MHQVTAYTSTQPGPNVNPLHTNEADEWDTYVHAHPRGTLCHATPFRAMIESTFGHQTVYSMPRDRIGAVSDTIPAVRLHSHFLVTNWSQPYFSRGHARQRRRRYGALMGPVRAAREGRWLLARRVQRLRPPRRSAGRAALTSKHVPRTAGFCGSLEQAGRQVGKKLGSTGQAAVTRRGDGASRRQRAARRVLSGVRAQHARSQNPGVQQGFLCRDAAHRSFVVRSPARSLRHQ